MYSAKKQQRKNDVNNHIMQDVFNANKFHL